MKKLLLGATLLAGLSIGPALAADLKPAPVYKAPPAPPPPVYAWTGCYIGGNVGWARSETRFAGDGSTSADGFAGGGQLGCDYQFASNWVVGIQGLFDGTDISRSHTSVLFPGDTFHAKANWFGTVTGRLGFLVAPSVMIYGKGGWGFVDQKLTVTDTASGAALGSASKNFNGPDAGAGAEWMFAPGWSVWAEWDHIFGQNKTLVFTDLQRATFSENVKRNFDKVLVGVNWRFGGGGGAPITGRY
jgi:outer membrane immunogenic protein